MADAKAQAAALEAKISQTSMQIGTLGQQYDAAKYHEEQLQVEIGKTKDAIASQQAKVADDRVRLRKAAINAYISNGTAANSNPLFASDQRNFAAKVVYAKVAEGRLTSAVAKLTNSQDQLAVQQTKLQSQQSAAQAATASASSALQQAKTLQAQQDAALNQANSQVASLVKQAQQAKEAAQATQARAAASAPGGNSGGPTRSYPVPPPAPGGAGAVAAAMSQIGVPYVWAAMSPGVGFDCSGLTAWAWGQAGVGLPHYSGAQMSASTPVPSLADALPGDLIFYGPGGSAHVAMYIGGGSMIEAPQTGSFVHISPVRMDFVRIGRP